VTTYNFYLKDLGTGTSDFWGWWDPAAVADTEL
jgi:hypothetical protein